MAFFPRGWFLRQNLKRKLALFPLLLSFTSYCHVVAAAGCRRRNAFFNFISQVEWSLVSLRISLSVSDLALRISYLGLETDVSTEVHSILMFCLASV